MEQSLLITCEHAGNTVPVEYQTLFAGDPTVLGTHRGYDPGALEVARKLALRLGAPLFYTEISRLLVEANRTEGTEDHFSEFSKSLSEQQKQEVLDLYYRPYRKEVTNAIQNQVQNGKAVIHLSIHSFTPVLNDQERTADIGLLYDPARSREAAFCLAWEQELRKQMPELRILHNYPYLGTDDGFTTALRKEFIDEQYAGIELEINQRYPLGADASLWENVQEAIVNSVRAVAR